MLKCSYDIIVYNRLIMMNKAGIITQIAFFLLNSNFKIIYIKRENRMAEKNMDLCGLGNALVDLQFEVNEDEFKEIGYGKGDMILVEEDKQILHLNKLKDKQNNRCSGGSAANTIIAFSQFGGKSAYMTVLGNDNLGSFYASEFKSLGIELNAEHLNDKQTGTCLVLITPDSERTMLTYLGATSEFGENNINEEIIKRSKWIYIEGYKFSEESSTKAIYKAVDIAKKHGTKIAVTFSDTFITEIFKNHLEYVVDNADLLFCNESEALSYTKAETIEAAFGMLSEKCPNLAVTKGSKGSLIRWEGKNYEIPTYPASPKDTTGAGDMYAAGFLYGIIKSDNPERAGHFASIASASVVSQFGARFEEKTAKEIISEYCKIDY